MLLLFCALFMLQTWTYFPFALCCFFRSALQQSHDLGSGNVSNRFHDRSASKGYEIPAGFRCLSPGKADISHRISVFPCDSRGMWVMQKRIGKKLLKVSNKAKLWPNSREPWSLVSSTPHPCCLSHRGTVTSLHEVLSGDLSCLWALWDAESQRGSCSLMSNSQWLYQQAMP